MRLRVVACFAAMLIVTASPVHAYPRPGLNERIALNMAGGAPSAGAAYPTMTPDGRFVAFQTGAADIVPGDTNLAVDVYLRDRATGTSERISLASDGTEPNSAAWDPSINGDGRFVAFRSSASNLVPLDTNSASDIFVRDRQTQRTERVSVATGGAQGNGASVAPSISRDGRYVAFESAASNLVPGDTNGVGDIFVHDRATGATDRVSVGPGGVQANGRSASPSISGDGRIVVFYSDASNLVPDDTNGVFDLFAHDRATGVTERISEAWDGTQANGPTLTVNKPGVSGDGRYVAFVSSASNLVPSDTNGYFDVFVRDRHTRETERVSVHSDGSEPVTGSGAIARISDDGRYVVLGATYLAPGHQNNNMDIYVMDRHTGQAEPISVTDEGWSSNNGAADAVIDASGRYPVFATFATNMDKIPPPTAQLYAGLFLRDRGPEAGVLRAVPSIVDDEVAVQGMATYSGVVIADADDPSGDGATLARELGAELVGASLTYRPELGDLLARLRLDALPRIDGAAGAPGIVYGLAFRVNGIHHEVRASRLEIGAGTAGPQFALHRCDPTCVEIGRPKGGIGTTGPEVRVAVPLDAIDASEGGSLTEVRAFTGFGDPRLGAVSTLDEAAVPSATIPERHVVAGFAPAGTPESEVDFSVTAATSDAAFYASLGTLGPGSWDLWARACLGETCGSDSARITR